MSGTPTEAEVRTQLRAVVDVLETTRNFADGTMAAAGGKLDALLQALEGEYTAIELPAFCNAIRAGLSNLVAPGQGSAALFPCLLEYGRILSAGGSGGFGGGYRSGAELFRALYDWFVANSITILTRGITFDTTATLGAGNVGNGAMSRLTVDENNFPLEACHVEKKAFRCRADANSGTEKQAEVFEFLGTAQSFDALLRGTHGSGEGSRTTIISAHAGTGAGGSLLTNSSFSEYSASATPRKFTAWDETSGGAQLTQDTTNYYRAHPGAATNASLKITGGGGLVTIKQTLANMRVRRLDPNTPYFLRVMLNKTVGTAVGGTVTLRIGSQSVAVTIAALAANWAELVIPVGTGNWFRNFNEEPFDIEIEWSSSTSGFLLVDDVLFSPMTLIDGTWWFLRANAATHAPWQVDDTLEFTDTGGAAGTGKIQWWLWVSGYGYLPSSGVPTITDP